MAFHLFSAIENVDLERSPGSHMALVDVIETGDKGAALELTAGHIHDGYDLQVESLRAG